MCFVISICFCSSQHLNHTGQDAGERADSKSRCWTPSCNALSSPKRHCVPSSPGAASEQRLLSIPPASAGSNPVLAVCTSDKNISSNTPLSKQFHMMVDDAFKPASQPSSIHPCSPPSLHPKKIPNLFSLHGEKEVRPLLQAMRTPYYYIILWVLHVLMNVGFRESWGAGPHLPAASSRGVRVQRGHGFLKVAWQ